MYQLLDLIYLSLVLLTTGATVRPLHASSVSGDEAGGFHSKMHCYQTSARWRYNPTPRKLPWIVKSNYGLPSLCDAEAGLLGGLEGKQADVAATPDRTKWKVDPQVQWEWSAEGCPWSQFSYSGFCRAMASSGPDPRIFVFGDDLALALERRFLYNMLASRPNGLTPAANHPSLGCEIGYERDIVKRTCTGYYYCFDIMDGDWAGLQFVRGNGTYGTSKWEEFLTFIRPTVLLLNWVHPTKDITEYGRLLDAVLSSSQEKYPDVPIIYFSSPSVKLCPPQSQPDLPFISPPADVELRNAEARRQVEAHGALYLDLDIVSSNAPYELLQRYGPRASFEDCVDACQPGLLDAWVNLLYNAVITVLPSGYQPERVPSSRNWTAAVGDKRDGGIGKFTQAKFFKDAPTTPPPLKHIIPGASNSIRSRAQAEAVLEELSCFTHSGKWVYNPRPRRLAWPPFDLQYCDVHHVENGGIAGKEADEVAAQGNASAWTIRENLKWEWVTSKCSMEPFSNEEFCRAMGGRKRIFILGDSLNVQFAKTLWMNILMATPKELQEPSELYRYGKARWGRRGWLHKVMEFTACKGITDEPVHISFFPSSHLLYNELPQFWHIPWADKMLQLKPEVVVINAGAHYRPDEKFVPQTRRTLHYIRSILPDALILWRAALPGQPNCSLHKAPSEKPVKAPLGARWGWLYIDRQNLLTQPMVEEVGGVFMDYEYLSSFRPDGHIALSSDTVEDCLHWCEPGVVDTWVQIFTKFVAALH